MKTALLLALFSISSFATYEPITEFPEGNYLGMGHYYTDNDQEGYYASYAEVYYDGWELYYGREYGLAAFSLSFDFANNGFFKVNMVEHLNHKAQDHNGQGQDKYYEGEGYCGSVQCHVSVDMGSDRKLEETVSFATWENKLYRLGSLRKTFANGHSVITKWEEKMDLMTANGNNKRD